jgi:hypothetical protein
VPAPERSRNGPGTSKRSADRSRRSAAFSFKSSPSHRMANARDRWPARTGSPVRRHPRQRNVAQRSPSSPSADGRLFHRDPLWAARKRPPLLERPPAIKIGGLESEPCTTATYQIHGHEDVTVIKERTPRPGHAIKPRAVRAEATKNRAGERWPA